ncbi:hypothetical protein KDM87_07960 [Undibacterium sp. FT147W]|uniref:Uncharacterized protein n=1 Tax=Undibacterium rivi TaxID=2828729 RepID=A0ABS5H1I3_9BURK|nr:hypothetical protein [Undibacterium rivi]MBR7792532.1 hypothetical protein [Undibacterium rivi]
MPNYFSYFKALAIRIDRAYSVRVPKKKGNEFGDSNFTKAHRPRNAAFLRAYVIASSLRAAVAGIPSGMPGSFVSGSPTPSFAAHPFGDGRSATTTQRSLP